MDEGKKSGFPEPKVERLEKSDAEWRALLSPEQYRILRQKGTERPFSGEFNGHKAVGTYACAACGLELFRSDLKFESGCGWPSFFDVIEEGRIRYEEDRSHGMRRIEVMCGRCDGHLGHVFPDGPPPTRLRYCINSVSLVFEESGQ